MNGIQKLLYNLSGAKALTNLPAVINQRFSDPRFIGLNNGVTIYPYSNDLTYIEKGYNKNAWVYAIVSKLAKKFGQIPFYHYKIKTDERKTWFEEYLPLSRNHGFDTKAMIELRKMRKKSVDQTVVDSPLSKLLAKPNRNQSGAQFREQLFGYKLLTGEGNTWLSRQNPGDKPSELFIIPKDNLALVRGNDPWDIARYVLILGAGRFEQDKDNIIMWISSGYNFDPYTLAHLRGQSPLDAGLLTMQASNEGQERQLAMNKNQGAAGLAFNKINTVITAEQAMFMRKQFDSIVNSKDMAGSIAVMNGEWDYLQFGLDAVKLQLLEQSDIQFKTLCNIYDIPWQLFGTSDSYENRKQYKRDLIYDNIAVAAYSYRDQLNAKLIREYGLDRDRDVIDCDILSLPELSEDMKAMADWLTKIWQLTPNQVLEQMGFEMSTDPLMDKIYIPSGYSTLEQMNTDLGSSLDAEMNMLNQNNDNAA